MGKERGEMEFRNLVLALMLVLPLSAGAPAVAQDQDAPADMTADEAEIYDKCMADPGHFNRLEVADPAAYCTCQASTRYEAFQQGFGELGAMRLAAVECEPILTN
jgi:hypothetical protein